MKKKWLAVGIFLLFLGTYMIPAIAQYTEKSLMISEGTWWYVGGSGPGNYTRIQDAIDNASTGDTVFVFGGYYFETIIINTSITLLGEHRKTTVIDGREQGTVVTIRADGVSLCNFTIQNSADPYTSYHYGVRVESNNNSIKNNILGPKNSVGLLLSRAHNNTIIRNRFLYNRDAFDLHESNNNLIVENTFGFSLLFAITIWDSGNNTIHDNNFIFNMFFVLCGGNTPEDVNNSWNGNYWNSPRHSPKPILVLTGLLKPSFQYDRNPAVIPHGDVVNYTNVKENIFISIKGRVDGLFDTSPWDGTGLRVGRLPTVGILLNGSLRGDRIKYKGWGRGENYSYQFGGSTWVHAVIELQDAFGIFYYQKASLIPTFAPRFRALCFVKKMTTTHYDFLYT